MLRKAWVVAAAMVLVYITAMGCYNIVEPQPQNEISVDPNPTERKVEITLYFAGPQASYVFPEKRTVRLRDGVSLAQIIVEELIKGPRTKELAPTLPEGTKILSVDVNDGIAYVNLSKEVKTNHSGGSAGELMTLASVVNSLTELDAVDRVQFLVEGRIEESIWGHSPTGEPRERMENLIKNK